MQVADRGGLREDTTQGEVGRICFHCKGQIWLKMQQDGSCGEGLLQGLEGCTRRDRLGKLDSLACEGSEGTCEGGVVVDEFYVEVFQP